MGPSPPSGPRARSFGWRAVSAFRGLSVVVIVFWPIEPLGGIPVAKRKAKVVAAEEPKIAKTWSELARELGMGGKDPERILQRLGTRPDFPGKPGRPGRRDGHFPVEDIRAWLATIRTTVDQVDDEEITAVTKRVKLLELEEKEAAAALRLGKLADVDEVGQYCVQVVNNARAILASIEDEVVGALPATVPAKVRTTIYRRVQKIRDAAMLELQRLSEGDTDETAEPDE
jgi:hypothetical protein